MVDQVLDKPGALLLLIFLPAGLWFLFRPARWKGMHVRGDRIVFPTSTGWQLAGILVLLPFIAMAINMATGHMGKREWGPAVISLVFSFAGVSVLFREVQLDRDGFTKRLLWRTEKIQWQEAEELTRLENRSWVLSGGLKRIVFNRQYADFELLVLEALNRLNAKRETPATDRGEGRVH